MYKYIKYKLKYKELLLNIKKTEKLIGGSFIENNSFIIIGVDYL